MLKIIWNTIRITWMLVWIIPCWIMFLAYCLLMLIVAGPEEAKLFWESNI